MKHSNEIKAKSKEIWVEGTVQDFLELSDADMAMIEARLAASRLLRATREKKRLTQHLLAAILKTSQSRFAKMEAGHPSVSLDLLLRSLFVLGVSNDAVATIFRAKSRRAVRTRRNRQLVAAADRD